jgi:hypothetical protein
MYSGKLSSTPTGPWKPNGKEMTQNVIYNLVGQFVQQSDPGSYPWSADAPRANIYYIKDVEIIKPIRKDFSKDAKDSYEYSFPPLNLHPNLQATDFNAMVYQLMLRVSAIEQRLATGQSFIASPERPAVGQQAVNEAPPRTDDTTNT